MRVLLTIHHELDPDSGAPGATFRLGEEYRSQGHDVEVLDFRRLLPRRLPEQAKMVAFPWAVSAWLARRGRRSRFDVIDASTGDTWIFEALRRAFPVGARRALVVVRSHGLEHTMTDRRRSEAKAEGESLSWKYSTYHAGFRLWEVAHSLLAADVALFLNDYDRTVAIDHLSVLPERARVVRNGISKALIGLPEPKPSGAVRRIAVIGSYIARKGVDDAATALNAWLPLHPDWAVTFLGTGVPVQRVLDDYRPDLRNRISVVPRYANAGLQQLLDGHQIHLFATLSEGAPVSLLEAMACGLAPIASAVPGVVEAARDGYNALLVPPAEPEAIKMALDRLAGDGSLLERLRFNAHLTAQSYGWGEIAGEQLAIYEEQSQSRGDAQGVG